MKNTLWISFLLALLMNGCSQEEMLRNGTSASGKGRTFTTEFEQNDSRTYVENGLYSRWTEGDRVSLFDANTMNRQYLFAGETGDTGGTFFMLSKTEGTGTALNANYAVYPYDKDMTISSKGTITLTLPSIQHYAENSYGLGDNTMVAVTENADDTFLQFKNVGGCFKFQLYGDDVTVKSITLKGNNGEKIAGKATLAPAYGKAPAVTMADDATTSITLNCGEKGVKIGSSAEEATAFWVVIPPTTFEKGITIVVKDIDNNVFTQTTDKLLAIERNVVKPMVAVKVEPEFPQLAFSADEKELEGWSAGLFGGEGTYVIGKPHGDNGYLMTIGNILENESAIVYMDESKQLREIFIDNTIITFGNNINGGVDVSIIEEDGTEIVEHMVCNNHMQSRSTDDYSKQEGTIGLAKNMIGMYEAIKDLNESINGSDYKVSLKQTGKFLGNKAESIRNMIKAFGGPDIAEMILGEDLVPWLDGALKLGDLGEAAAMYGSKALGGPIVGCILVYADLINTYNEQYDKHIKAYYGNSIAEIEDITFENKGLNIDVKVSGYEPWYDLECGVIVKKSNLLFAPPAGKFPSNIETITVTQDGIYPFFVGDKEVDETYWCYPFLIEKSRTSLWIGFIGDMAGPLVRYGKAIKYEPDNGTLREALIKLYNSTNGDNWIYNDNWCSDKPITEWLGVIKNADDEYVLWLFDNNLTGKIDQTFPDDIKIILDCSGNQLTSLDVSGCTTLKNLFCYDNQLTSLDVSGCTELTQLACQDNQLTFLDVSGCSALQDLNCSDNQLTSLDVSGYTDLIYLGCSDNQLTSLNVSGCTELEGLWCSNNRITSVIPVSFKELSVFSHDIRYLYLNLKGDYEDLGVGWWYPGEPEKGKHSPD